ncbi:sodium:solute symporter family protein [Chryseolinea sp. T2]|uniref:sodium:solute symporter family protein n=1 Tax=Chryseolinea sp. T2 TaxID=3129255 RepID=UPI0030786340
MYASRRVQTSGDFMLAGRSLPLMISSAALFATWFGSETVFGATSRFLEGGLYSVIEDPFGAALCLVLFGMFFARRLYQMNLMTLGDFFKVRYSRKVELVASLFLAPPYLGYIAAQLVAMGLVLSVVTGLDLWVAVTLSAVVVTMYTYVGGMWAISITDFFQSIIIILGLVVLAFVLMEQGGGIGKIMSEIEPGSMKFLPDRNFKEVVAYLAAWSVLGLGSIPSQDVFQRAMSSGSAKTAVWSCYIGAGLYLTVAIIPLFISLCIKHLYAGSLSSDTQMALPAMVLAHTSMPIQIMFFGSLLSAILSTASSAILAPAAIFSENLIKPLAGNRLNDKQLLTATRISVLAFSVCATIMACLRSDIYELVGESSILSLVSLFVPLTFGLYWSKASNTGAMISMIAGMMSWIIFEFLEIDWPTLVPATLISLVAMIAGSLIWPKKSGQTK